MLPDAEMQILTTGVIGLKISGALVLQRRLVRRTEIGRSAQKPRNILRQNGEHLAGSFAASDTLWISRKSRQILIPSLRQLPALHEINIVGQFGIFNRVRGEHISPLAARFRTARTDARHEMLPNSTRHQKLCARGPPVAAFGKTDLIVAERLAMSLRGILLVRRTVTDVAVEDDEGWGVRCSLEDLQSDLNSVDVIGITDPQNVPAVTLEPGSNVLSESNPRISLDCNVVVIVDPAEVAQTKMARE